MRLLNVRWLVLLAFLIVLGSLLEIAAIAILGLVLTGGELTGLNVPFDVSFKQLLLCAAVIWIFNGLMNTFVQFSIIKFSFGNGLSLSVKSLKKFIENNSNVENARSIIDIVVNEVGRVIGGVLIPALVLLQKTFTLIFTVVFITTVFGSKSLIILVVLLGVYSLLVASTQSSVNSNGRLISENNNLRTDILMDIEDGKDLIKINSVEKLIISKFIEKTKKLFWGQISNQTYAAAPKYILETIVVLSLIFMLGVNQGDENISSQILILGAAAIKILPNLQGAYSSIMLLRGHLNSWEFIKSYLDYGEKVSPRVKSIFAGTEIDSIFFKKVSIERTYGLSIQVFDFNLHVGKVIGLIGESGSGKTSFGHAICGLNRDATIEILLKGSDPISQNIKEVEPWMFRSLWGYVPQTPFLFNSDLIFNLFHTDTVEKKLYERATAVLERFGLLGSLPSLDWTKIRVGRTGINLSGGQKQRIVIASSIVKDRKFIFFDEATSALDIKTSEKIQKIIADEREFRGIVMVTHNSKQLLMCDEVLEFKKGKICKRYDKKQILKKWGHLKNA